MTLIMRPLSVLWKLLKCCWVNSSEACNRAWITPRVSHRLVFILAFCLFIYVFILIWLFILHWQTGSSLIPSCPAFTPVMWMSQRTKQHTTSGVLSAYHQHNRLFLLLPSLKDWIKAVSLLLICPASRVAIELAAQVFHDPTFPRLFCNHALYLSNPSATLLPLLTTALPLQIKGTFLRGAAESKAGLLWLASQIPKKINRLIIIEEYHLLPDWFVDKEQMISRREWRREKKEKKRKEASGRELVGKSQGNYVRLNQTSVWRAESPGASLCSQCP